MDSFAEVIEAFEVRGGYAAAVSIRESHARTMKARDSIPPHYWGRTVRAARRLGIRQISYQALAALAERRHAKTVEA